MSASLFLKDPAASRFLAGGLAEVEDLFGSPLPDLPALELDEGRSVFLVHVHSRLRSLQQRFLEAQLAQIGAITLRGGDPGRDYSEYEAALARVARSVRQADRRQGLLNLFWLAHSRHSAEHLRGLESRSPALRRAKVSGPRDQVLSLAKCNKQDLTPSDQACLLRHRQRALRLGPV